MDNYKKQILQRVIDFYIEKSDADKETIRTVACLMNDIEAINYSYCCKELPSKEEIRKVSNEKFNEWRKSSGVDYESHYLGFISGVNWMFFDYLKD